MAWTSGWGVEKLHFDIIPPIRGHRNMPWERKSADTTYCISRRNFFGGKQLRVLSGSNRATRCALICGALGDPERAREMYTTPPSTARSARCAPAGASLQTSTADPEAL